MWSRRRTVEQQAQEVPSEMPSHGGGDRSSDSETAYLGIFAQGGKNPVRQGHPAPVRCAPWRAPALHTFRQGYCVPLTRSRVKHGRGM